MKIRNLILGVTGLLSSALPLSAEAALATQSLEIAKGWGAYLFEVSPSDAEPDAVFADTPVAKAFCYLPDALTRTATYDDDGIQVETENVSYRQWVRGDAALSDLKQIVGGYVYVLFATNAASGATALQLVGDPAIPHFHWRRATSSGGGIAALAAPSLDAGVTKTLAEYFGEGPWDSSTYKNAYYVNGNTTRTVPIFMTFRDKQKVEAGKGYGFVSTAETDWPGVIDVRGVGSGGVTFDEDDTAASFQIRNAGTKSRVISLTLQGADAATGSDYELPPISEFDETNILYYALGAGDAVTVSLHCDPTERTSADGSVTNAYQGVLVARDETGGTGMRVRFPIKADSVPSGNEWPTGFHVGSFALTEAGTDGNLMKAGGTMKGRLILRVDGNFKPTLLQRLCLGQVDGQMAFYKDLEDETNATVRANLKRISVATMDPQNPTVAEKNGLALSGSSKTVTFEWTVGEKSSANPFYHPYHPDHDGVVYQSSGAVVAAPSGDTAKNYQSSTKPELFSIRNTVTLAFDSIAWNADEELTGTITWKIHGLREMSDSLTGGVTCRGTFALQRVDAASGYAR